MASAAAVRDPRQRTNTPQVARANVIEDETVGENPQVDDLAPKLSAQSTENLLRMLECLVCKDYLTTRPMHTACCGAVFCKRCIVAWIRSYLNCPVCRANHSVSMLTPARHVQRIASELKNDLCPPEDNAVNDAAPPAQGDNQDELRNNAVHVIPNDPLNQVNNNRGGVPIDPLDVALRIVPARDGNVCQCHFGLGRRGNFVFYFRELNHPMCIAMRQKDEVDGSVVVNIKTREGRLLAVLERRPGCLHYVASTADGDSEIFAMDASSKDAVVVLPRINEIDAVERMMRPYEPRSRRDSIANQLHRPDLKRVMPFQERSEPAWTYDRCVTWCRANGRCASEMATKLLLVGSRHDKPLLMMAPLPTKNELYILDFAYPISPLQAFAIGLSALDRQRHFLQPRREMP
ncbi:unnamed protein product [Aphanomyces euteiches]